MKTFGVFLLEVLWMSVATAPVFGCYGVHGDAKVCTIAYAVVTLVVALCASYNYYRKTKAVEMLEGAVRYDEIVVSELNRRRAVMKAFNMYPAFFWMLVGHVMLITSLTDTDLYTTYGVLACVTLSAVFGALFSWLYYKVNR